ncbi:MAG: ATP synthase F1 subunit gamma [Solobacterium sp.]|nr:ATP synthase F1 subunit gamma [Solobacterium sp.]MBQ6505798.1 ATP synthase F1 subunit gamma [Clostridia bacterium]MBR2990481.1 ATP synthase F1 subunit gamma [Solobacterium sp.]
MAQSKQALRSRIKSVNSTRKITKAMEMIANAKLFRQRNRMEANREYSGRLQETVDEIVAKNSRIDSIFLKKHAENPARLSILFCSDLGLCGAYNQNMMKLARDTVRKEDPMVVIGTSLYQTMKDLGFNVINENPIETDKLTFDMLKAFIDYGTTRYLNQDLGGVQILYTQFVNTMTFRPCTDVILPCTVDTAEGTAEEPAKMQAETLFEPDAETILNSLIPMMLSNVAYSHWMEATTAEQGSRRMAMKTATDNADELSEALLLEYNKARQASITQEITEIVGGSTAV